MRSAIWCICDAVKPNPHVIQIEPEHAERIAEAVARNRAKPTVANGHDEIRHIHLKYHEGHVHEIVA